MRRPQGQKVVKKLNVNKLKLPAIQQELAVTLKGQLTEATGNDWESLKTTVQSAPLQVIGPATRNHQDWFDESDFEIQTLLEENCQLHEAHLSDPSSDTRKLAYDSKSREVTARLAYDREVQKTLRVMQDTWPAIRPMRYKAALTGMT